jgi:High potential iron-sulfur protein
MSNQSSKFTKEISRRTVLQAVAAVGAVPALMMATAPASAKMSQAGVAYQGSPHGSSNCGNCKLFVAPSSCKSVAGAVSANGWCKIWAKA